MAFKILRKNCCGLDIHKTWIFACIGITDSNGRTEYKQARFSSFSNGLRDLADWLAKYSCSDVCMESTGKYWIPVFNILEKTCWVTSCRQADGAFRCYFQGGGPGSTSQAGLYFQGRTGRRVRLRPSSISFFPAVPAAVFLRPFSFCFGYRFVSNLTPPLRTCPGTGRSRYCRRHTPRTIQGSAPGNSSAPGPRN